MRRKRRLEMKLFTTLLMNLPVLLWLALRPPTQGDLLKIIEAEQAAERRKKLDETPNDQSHLLSK